MTTTRNNRRTAWAFGIVLATAGGAAHADVFYNALPANPSSNSTISNSIIGGANVFGNSFDLQSADDFVLTSAMGSAITNLTFDMATFTNMGANSLPPQVMVEFFADAGGRPADAATASTIIGSGGFASVTQFEGDWPQDDGSNPPGFRIGLDLSGAGVVLGAGTWWVAVQGIGDDNVYSIMAAQRDLHQTGALVHWRGGGLAHGNGFTDGGLGFDWIPSTFDSNSVGDLSLLIEGFVVPAPGGAALLGLLGLTATARRRR